MNTASPISFVSENPSEPSRAEGIPEHPREENSQGKHRELRVVNFKCNLHERSLGMYLAMWSIPLMVSMYITYMKFFPELGSCGKGSSCALVQSSVFGSLLGIPLSSVGVVFYSIPMVFLYFIRVSRSKGHERVEIWFWLLFYQFGLFALGFELYLVTYAQMILGAFCIWCTVLGIVVFAAVCFNTLIDGINSDWPKICLWPKPALIIFAFLALHFALSPTGAYDAKYSPHAQRKMEMAKLRMETYNQYFNLPYQVEPYGTRQRTSVLVSSVSFDEALPKLDHAKIEVYSKEQLTGVDAAKTLKTTDQVIVAKKSEKTLDLYPLKTYLDIRREGSVNAPITITIYSDYGCPNCKIWDERELPRLRENYVAKGLVQLVYRYYNLKHFQYSDFAAKVSAAATFQGTDIWLRVNQRLHQTSEDWSIDGDPTAYVRDLVNMKSLSEVLSNFHELDSLLARESALSQDLGLQMVPSFSILSKGLKKPDLYQGYTNYRVISEILTRTLKMETSHNAP